VDGDRATIGAGARLVDVYDQLTAKGVAIPAGSCPTVGIAGLTQGGGIGVVDRAFGLTCDRLVSATVVTADGRTRTCDATREPDLFWALRGGGGGNFGVATSFTFATHKTRDLTTFIAIYAPADALRVFSAWQDWLPTLPDTTWAQASISFGEDPASASFAVFGVCVGDEPDLRPYWTRFLDDAGAATLFANVATRSYRDTLLGSACGDLSVAQCHLPGQTPEGKLERVTMAASSDYFDKPMPADGVQAVIQALLARSESRRRGSALFDSMGGAIARVAPDATAFVHRKALYSVQYLAQYPPGADASVIDEAAGWVHGMRAVAAPWSSGGAYPNYVDPLLTDWRQAYYGSNYARLVSVKAQYDPDQVFRLPQGIPPR
jgi:FAD/FMN-containing dehydrogenase